MRLVLHGHLGLGERGLCIAAGKEFRVRPQLFQYPALVLVLLLLVHYVRDEAILDLLRGSHRQERATSV